MTGAVADAPPAADCPPPAADPGLPLSMAGGRNPWLLAATVSIATFMEVLDTSIANVALLHIAGELGADVDESTWVLTSYLVSNAIILPLSGWLSTVIGRKPFYMGCVALFTAGSLACGLAPSLAWLIVFRVLQGLGGGGLAPSEQAILHDSFPQAKWGKVFAVYGITVVAAPAVGPPLGGWITDNFSWRWIFLINVPVGALSLGLSYLLLQEPEAECERRRTLWRRGLKVDYWGFGLTALGLGCLQVVLDKGERDDWFGSDFIIGFSCVAGAALVALVIRELLVREPVVNLRLLKIPSFAAANAMMFAMGFILFGSTQLLPQFVQEIYGYTATDAGLIIAPGGFAVMALMPLVGWLLGKVQPKYLVMLGMAIEAAALWHLTGLNDRAAFADLAWARVFQAAGLAFLFVPITTVAYVGLPDGTSNDASALVNLSRNLGGSFGISLAQTWIARRSQFHQSRLVEHLTPYDATYRQALDGLAGPLVAGGTPPAEAHRRGLGELYAMLNEQAATLAFLDVFFLMACAAALLLPVAFLLRRVDRDAPGHG